MKIRVYNENGIIRIVEVTNRGTEITVFGSLINGEVAELKIRNDVIDCGESDIKKICKYCH